MRGQPAGHSLQATALVNEVYLKLGEKFAWNDRRHLLMTAARAMRQVLVDHARRKSANKRAGIQLEPSLDGLGGEYECRPGSGLRHRSFLPFLSTEEFIVPFELSIFASLTPVLEPDPELAVLSGYHTVSLSDALSLCYAIGAVTHKTATASAISRRGELQAVVRRKMKNLSVANSTLLNDSIPFGRVWQELGDRYFFHPTTPSDDAGAHPELVVAYNSGSYPFYFAIQWEIREVEVA